MKIFFKNLKFSKILENIGSQYKFVRTLFYLHFYRDIFFFFFHYFHKKTHLKEKMKFSFLYRNTKITKKNFRTFAQILFPANNFFKGCLNYAFLCLKFMIELTFIHLFFIFFLYIQIATEGCRPALQPGMPSQLSKLISLCWNADPTKRPRFDQIMPILQKML